MARLAELVGRAAEYVEAVNVSVGLCGNVRPLKAMEGGGRGGTREAGGDVRRERGREERGDVDSAETG